MQEGPAGSNARLPGDPGALTAPGAPACRRPAVLKPRPASIVVPGWRGLAVLLMPAGGLLASARPAEAPRLRHTGVLLPTDAWRFASKHTLTGWWTVTCNSHRPRPLNFDLMKAPNRTRHGSCSHMPRSNSMHFHMPAGSTVLTCARPDVCSSSQTRAPLRGTRARPATLRGPRPARAPRSVLVRPELHGAVAAQAARRDHGLRGVAADGQHDIAVAHAGRVRALPALQHLHQLRRARAPRSGGGPPRRRAQAQGARAAGRACRLSRCQM